MKYILICLVLMTSLVHAQTSIVRSEVDRSISTFGARSFTVDFKKDVKAYRVRLPFKLEGKRLKTVLNALDTTDAKIIRPSRHAFEYDNFSYYAKENLPAIYGSKKDWTELSDEQKAFFLENDMPKELPDLTFEGLLIMLLDMKADKE